MILLTSIYAVLVIGFGFWWAENFTDYSHFKGEESLFEIKAVGIATLIAFVTFRVVSRKLAWWFIITMPFLTGFLSVCITLFMPSSGFIEGTTQSNLRIYGVVHTLLAIIAAGLHLLAERRSVRTRPYR